MKLPHLIVVATALLVAAKVQTRAKSQWVYLDPKGELAYKALPRGDRIMDFSYAGYMGGGISLPSATVKFTLSPASGDNTAAIQTIHRCGFENAARQRAKGSRTAKTRYI